MSGTREDKHQTSARFGGDVSRRRFLETAGIVGAGGAFLALTLSSLKAQAAEGPLKLGTMGPFTGPASRTGDEFKNGVAMAIEDAKAAGELPLVLDGKKRDIELVFIDSQSSPEKAVKAVTDAVTRRGVEFIVNGWHSSVAMAIIDSEVPLKIVHIGHLGESQYISEKINTNPNKYRGYFKGWPSPPVLAGLYGPPLQHFVKEGLWKPANMKAAILVEDTDFGRGWGDAIIVSLTKAGFDVLPYDVTALDETEFSPLLTRYKAQKVSLVGMTSTGSVSVTNFVKQLRSQRLKALLIGHGLGWFGEWYEMTGDASDHVVAIDSPHVITPWQQEWVDRYKAKFGIVPGIAASGITYDYMRMAIMVLNKAGTLDFDTLVKTVHDTKHKGVWNLYKFSTEAGPNALAPNEAMTGDFMKGFFFPMVQFMKGKPNIIWPLEHAKASFQAPPWL